MKRKLLKFVLSLMLIAITLLAIIFYLSPQKTAPFTDHNGKILKNSIAEIKDIELNGLSQRILIRGKNKDKPILLHLHGGPGSPDHPFMSRDNYVLENLFTVCYWEHRGSGASYAADIPEQTMTLNQIVDDGIELSQYLLKTFQKDKLYLQGHSWGTLVAAHMAQKNPNLFHAYFGIGQIVNTKRSDQLSYDFAYQAAKKANDQESLEQLEAIGRPPYPNEDEWTKAVRIERGLMRKYQDALIQREESMIDIYKAFIFYPEYSITDKLGALKGDPYSMNKLWPEVIKHNLIETIPSYDIPVYLFHGKHDYTVVTSITKSYFDSLKAPIKQFYEFENAAHSPQLESFEEYKTIIQKIMETHASH